MGGVKLVQPKRVRRKSRFVGSKSTKRESKNRQVSKSEKGRDRREKGIKGDAKLVPFLKGSGVIKRGGREKWAGRGGGRKGDGPPTSVRKKYEGVGV